MSRLFISHSSQDDAFVRELQQALGDLQQDVWIDSRELRGGDPLWPEIQKAISLQAIVAGTRDRSLADAPELRAAAARRAARCVRICHLAHPSVRLRP